MNDKETKYTMKESLLSPSADFTDDLMNKIAVEVNMARKFRWMVVLVGLFSVAFFLFLLGVKAKVFFEVSYLSYTIKISKFLIQTIGIIFILYVIHQLMELHKDLVMFKQNKALQSG